MCFTYLLAGGIKTSIDPVIYAAAITIPKLFTTKTSNGIHDSSRKNNHRIVTAGTVIAVNDAPAILAQFTPFAVLVAIRAHISVDVTAKTEYAVIAVTRIHSGVLLKSYESI